MKVTWTVAALRQLRSIEASIGHHDPAAASRVVTRIERGVTRLGRMPLLGRPVRARDVRALVISGTRDTVAYALRVVVVLILALLHERQQRPTSFSPG